MKIKLSIFFAFIFLFSQAQNIDIDKEIIKVDKIPYAKIAKKNVGIMRNDYIISTIDGVELIYFKCELAEYNGVGYMYGNNKLIYQVYFTQSKHKVYIEHLNLKEAAKLVVENKLLKDNKIDLEAEKRFILLNNGTWEEDDKKDKNIVINNYISDTNAKVQKSSNQIPPIKKVKIEIIENRYLIDGKDYGKYKLDTMNSSFSQKEIKLSIYAEDGEKIASAVTPLDKPEEWSLTSSRDNKISQVLYDAPNEIQTVIRWLVNKNYIPLENE